MAQLWRQALGAHLYKFKRQGEGGDVMQGLGIQTGFTIGPQHDPRQDTQPLEPWETREGGNNVCSVWLKL